MSVGRPQVDTCYKCDQLKVKISSPTLNDTAKRVAIAKLSDVHKEQVKFFSNKMGEITKICKADPSVRGITFDYMQKLQLLVAPVQ